MPSQQLLRALGESLGSGALVQEMLALSGGGGEAVFNVTDPRYGAVGDGLTDDTAAIQAAFAAAAAATAADATAQARVAFPTGTYVAGSTTLAGSPAVEVTGDRIHVSGDGTLMLADGSAADSVLEISGDYCTVQDLIIDANISGVPTGRGEGVRVSGSYNTLHGVTAQNTTDDASGTGVTFMIWPSAIATVLSLCVSRNSGSTAVSCRGDYTHIQNFRALEHLDSGLATAGGDLEQITIDGWYGESSVTTKTGLLFDNGYESADTGYMINHIFVSNVTINLGANATFGNGVKIARVRQVNIDNLNVFHTSILGQSLRIAEAVGHVRIANSHLSSTLYQEDGATDITGSLTGATITDGGFAKFASTGHTLRTGDYIILTGTASYDGLHNVTASATGVFTTDWKYTAADATGTFAIAAGSLAIKDTTIGTIGQTAPNDATINLKAQRISFERVRILNFERDAIQLSSTANFPHAGFKSIEVKDCDFVSNCPAAVGYAIRSVGGHFTQENVIRWLGNNTIRDLGAFGCTLAQSGTLPVITRGNSRPYRAITGSTTLTAADSGGLFVVTGVDAVVTLPSVASVTAGGGTIEYTFVLAAAGLSAGTGLSISPNAADKIMGNGFTSLDDKDAILSGASDREGDLLTIRSDGVDGWRIVEVIGTWARE